jgi:V/A-type H+-transporting ATPase subunit K
MELSIFLGILGAVLSISLAGVGSILGIRLVGEAGMSIINEEPSKFGRVLLLQALPGTQGVYGFLVAIMILQKLGILGGNPVGIPLSAGILTLIAGLPVGILGFLSALHQAKVALQGLQIVAQKPEEFGKPIIMAALVETYAVLGLLISILIISGIKI